MVQREPAAESPYLRVRRERGYTVLEFAGEIDISAAAEIAPCSTPRPRSPAPGW